MGIDGPALIRAAVAARQKQIRGLVLGQEQTEAKVNVGRM